MKKKYNVYKKGQYLSKKGQLVELSGQSWVTTTTDDPSVPFNYSNRPAITHLEVIFPDFEDPSFRLPITSITTPHVRIEQIRSGMNGLSGTHYINARREFSNIEIVMNEWTDEVHSFIERVSTERFEMVINYRNLNTIINQWQVFGYIQNIEHRNTNSSRNNNRFTIEIEVDYAENIIF